MTRSSIDIMNQVIRIAKECDRQINSGNIKNTKSLFQIISNFSYEEFSAIKSETGSWELMNAAVKIRNMAVEAVKALDTTGDLVKAKELIQEILKAENLLISADKGLLSKEKEHSSVQEIRAYLLWIHDIRPSTVRWNIKQGDLIPKTSSRTEPSIYLDDIKLVRDTFCGSGGIPVKIIFNHFAKRPGSIFSDDWIYAKFAFDFNGVPAINFSYLVNNRVGECIEMALTAQICAEYFHRESYFISGFITLEESGGLESHAWNMIVKDGIFYILDIAQEVYGAKVKEIKKLNNTDIEIVPFDKLPIRYFFL
jgi:hypothetical protein